MRTTLKCTLVAILSVCTVISVVRIARWLQQLKQQARFSVLDSDTSCGKTDHQTLELKVLTAKDSKRATLQLNGNSSNWDEMPAVLNGLFSVRAEKFIYLRVAPDVSSSDESNAFHLIEKAGAERLCLLDFKAPHKYTPYVGGGS